MVLRKVSWVFLAVLLAVLLCAPAYGTGSREEPTSPTAVGKDPYQPIPGKKYEISVAYIFTSEKAERGAPVLDYIGKQLGVDIVPIPLERPDYSRLISLRLAAGDVPDIFYANGIDELVKFANQGVAAGLTMDLLQRFAPDYLKRVAYDFKGNLEQGLNYLKVNGVIYALDRTGLAESEMVGRPYRCQPIIRADWLKAVGLSPKDFAAVERSDPTLSEYEDMFYRFSRNDPDGNGKKDTYGLSKGGLDSIFGAYGVPIGGMYDKSNFFVRGDMYWAEDASGKLVCNQVQPRAREVLALLNKWYKDQVLDPEFITGENIGGYWGIPHAYMNGRIGMTAHARTYHVAPPLSSAALMAGSNQGDVWVEAAKISRQFADTMLVADPPIGPYGDRGGTHEKIPFISAKMFGKQLEKEPDKFAKAVQLMNFGYVSLQNQNVVEFGIPDKMWKWETITADLFNSKQYKSFIRIGEFTKHPPEYYGGGVVENAESWSFPEYESPVADWCRSVNGDKWVYWDKKVVVVPSEVKYKVELVKILTEGYIGMVTGDKPLSYFDEMVALWRKNGGDQISKEVNDWWATIKAK